MGLEVVLAVILAAIASFISNLGVNLQKLHHIKARNASSSSPPPSSSTPALTRSSSSSSSPALAHYSSSLLWRLGLLLIIFGSLFDVAALGLGPQSLVAPLGSLTLVSNVLCAYALLKESVTRHDVLSTALIVIGATIAVAFGAHEQQQWSVDDLFHFFTQPQFIVYATIIVLFSIFCYVQLHRLELLELDVGKASPLYLQHRSHHRFYYPALAGTIGAQSVLFAKCSVELLLSSFRLSSPAYFLSHWQSYVVLTCMFTSIFLQIKYLNEGLRRFSSTYSIPVFQAFWILISVVSGLIFYREYEHMQRWDGLLFSTGVVIAVVGVMMLSGRDTEDHHHHHHRRDGHLGLRREEGKEGSEDSEDADDDLQLEATSGSGSDSDEENDASIEMSVLVVGNGRGAAAAGGAGGGADGSSSGLSLASAADAKQLKDLINSNGHAAGVTSSTSPLTPNTPLPSAEEEEKREADLVPLIPSRTSTGGVVVMARAGSSGVARTSE